MLKEADRAIESAIESVVRQFPRPVGLTDNDDRRWRKSLIEIMFEVYDDVFRKSYFLVHWHNTCVSLGEDLPTVKYDGHRPGTNAAEDVEGANEAVARAGDLGALGQPRPGDGQEDGCEGEAAAGTATAAAPMLGTINAADDPAGNLADGELLNAAMVEDGDGASCGGSGDGSHQLDSTSVRLNTRGKCLHLLPCTKWMCVLIFLAALVFFQGT